MIDKVKRDNERGARQSLLEDLFYDFHRDKAEIYKMNFIRGIFLGLGSVLGGTVLILFIIWILSLLVHIPGIGGPLEQVQQSLQNQQEQKK